MASSHVLKKLMRSPLLTAKRQSPWSKLFTRSGFQFHTSAEASASSFPTSKQFLRSIVPYRLQMAVGASLSHFINKKDFHVHVSDEDHGKVIEEKKDPNVARALAPWPFMIYNGECLSLLIYMPGMKSNHVNVTVGENELLCEGTRPDGKPATHVPDYTPNHDFPIHIGKQQTFYVANYIPVSLLPKKPPYTDVKLDAQLSSGPGTYTFYIKLPNKTYTPSDVEAKMKDCVLVVTINNVLKEDVAPFIK